MAIAPKDADYSLEAQLDEFRETIAPDVYSVSTFVPWAEIEAQVSAVAQPIAALQTLVDNDGFTKSRLTPALEDEPGIAEIARHLFTAPHAVGFSDGRELPERFNPAVHDACRVASLLLDLGLARLLPPGSPVAELYRIAVVAVDARRRGFRRRADLETRVNFLMDEALSTVGARAGAELKRIPPVEQPQEARGRGVEVIAADGRPVAAVATVFQASSGGRQSRDLSVTYPRLQEDLDGVPVSLLVIADGRGVLDASRRVLATLFESVAACMTLAQAEPSGLADALETAVAQRGVRTARRASLRTIIDTRLGHEVGVNASDLPAPRETAEAALAQYVADHDELALTLSRDGQRLEWTRTDAVGAAQALTEAYSAQQAVALLASALGLTDVADVPIADSGLVMTVGETRADPVLPPKLVVASTEAEVDEELVRATARSARQHVAGAGVAILLAENASEWQARSPALRAQRTLATSVVVVNSSRLVTLVGSIRPRDALVQAVLEQADLTKASPFQSTGATPPEMFVGREREVADLLGILATNSAALIGGRKIGKTSLLHRVVETLTGEGWLPFYADLQEAGDWRTFAEHVRLRWNVEVPEAFAPVNIAELVEQLQGRGTGRLVLALDEIDHLLRWDQDHGGAYVPEAFFRACRALSQEGAAQFVFSGERTIAERLWDPVSPHWNFCKPLPVRQLSREAADRLLAAPLASLGVSLADRRACLDLAWARTHGHPQIVQMLGEEIINRLNDRDLSDRRLVRSQEIASIVETAQYCERYVTTYWGQATPYEQLISVLLVRGAQTQGELRGALKDLGMPSDVDRLRPALRMLNLYGILEGVDEQLALRAEWLPEAMEALGGADRLTDDLVDVPE